MNKADWRLFAAACILLGFFSGVAISLAALDHFLIAVVATIVAWAFAPIAYYVKQEYLDCPDNGGKSD